MRKASVLMSVAVTAASMLLGCSTTDSTGVAESPRPPLSPPPASASPRSEFAPGDQAPTSGGFQLVVDSTELVPSAAPGSDSRLEALVHACLAEVVPRTRPGMETHLAAWRLELDNGTVLEPAEGGKEPAFVSATPDPAGCKRGYVAFVVPSGATPLAIVFTGDPAGRLRWVLPN